MQLQVVVLTVQVLAAVAVVAVVVLLQVLVVVLLQVLVAVVAVVVVVAVLQVPAAVDTVEDINPEDYINIDMTKDGLVLVYKSVSFYLEKWPGGDSFEQQGLMSLKDSLLRIILEQQFRNP